MENIIYFLLKLFISSAILLFYYWVALRNKQFHYYNRFYLLLVTVISLIIPFLRLQWFTVSSPNKQTVVLINSIQTGEGMPDLIVKQTTDPILFLYYVWAFISIILLAVLLVRIFKLLKIKSHFPKMEMDHFTFINTNLPQAPFSFLKNLFWRDDIVLEENAGKQILQHELTHIRQKHTYDKLFMQVILAVFWMNPIYWLIQKELYLIHEFIADEQAVEDNDAKAFAAMLLHSAYGKNMFSPAQSFSYSPIKRRLAMLTTPKNTKRSYLQKLMVLPLLTIIIGLFAFRMQQTEALQKAKTLIAKNGIGQIRDTTAPRNYGTYKGQAVKAVNIKQVAPKVIVTTTDGKKYEMTMKEAEQNKIFVPPPPPPPPSVEFGYESPTDKTARIENTKRWMRKRAEVLLDSIVSIKNKDRRNVIIDTVARQKYNYGNDNNQVVLKIDTVASPKYNYGNSFEIPRFPGGEQEWRKFLERNLNISVPVDNGASAGTYKVTVEFLVDAEGNVSEIRALNNPGFGTAEEAVRLIKKGPKWIPAKRNGEAVAYRNRQSVTFVVSEE